MMNECMSVSKSEEGRERERKSGGMEGGKKTSSVLCLPPQKSKALDCFIFIVS